MRNFTELEIREFLNNYDYDIRKSHDARWIDQKCTMDVISLISDCILEYVKDDLAKEFTVSDIWHNEYTVENVQAIFSKPNPNEKAGNEYDKYFGQPIKLLGYSKILNCEVRKNRNYYTINNYDLLSFLSIRERNAYTFLCLYIEKVLSDSGIYYLFNNFFENPSKDTYKTVKDGFSSFIIDNTPINGVVECNRIFIKVLNPLACKFRVCGTEKGRLSNDIITFDKISYNQKNWRDLYSNKPKGVSRDEYRSSLPEPTEDSMTTYKINRAKRFLRNYNNKYYLGKSELNRDVLDTDLATHMHHIFPVSYYPEIADYIENLIALTPTQHLNRAHPGNTSYIDKVYQYYCLLAKVDKIKENITSDSLPTIYSFSYFMFVLNVGFETNEFNNVDNLDFDEVVRLIEKFCIID